ncbi:inositol monophosphatase family protein [Tellurirhabdus bombi]|uniref:inositol monophosphatase family protein n=1 Tax=Tellurirhabdus bombi TaxID=2907205 RepID=UPI001F16196F|nr:inositol monophosphatase family protein [Tellurirhabdus bombi]
MPNDLNAITRQLTGIVKKTGAFLRTENQSFDRAAIEYKDFNNVVSYVDKEAEKQLVDNLSQLLPEAGFITEEGTTEQADRAGLNWIIDPLDGTANFIHKLPVFSVSVGLVDNGRPIAGSIYDVNRDECFSAWEGGGAWCSQNGGAEERIRVSPAQQLQESLIATGFPYYRFEQMQQYLHILESLMQKTHGLRRMGSAAIDLAYVACGRFDGFFEYNLKSWDMAGGVILVREAGGVVTDFTGGDEFLFRGDVVAGCAVHAELLAVIQEYWT